jgi:RNA polymerase sigma-70 factor (ECF subfamily)
MNDVAERAFRDHYANVVSFLRRRTRTSEEAEELAQAVFVQAAERLTPNGRAPVSAWLYTVARRKLVDEARRRARRGGPDVPLDEVALAARDPQYGTDVAAALRQALEQLSEPQRTVVVGRLIEGKSFAELAAAIGTSEAACKMRFVRGLASVRALFEEEGLKP